MRTFRDLYKKMWRSKESVVYLRKQKMIKNMNTTQTQTSVEWLEAQLMELISFNTVEMRELYRNKFKQAKQMEKEQRKQIYDNGYANGQMDLINQ